MKPKLWIRTLLLFLFVFCALLAWYLYAPLPVPKVSLKFEGYSMQGTNVAAMICFTNEGKKSVWWERSFTIIPETIPMGGMRRMTVNYSGWPSSTRPSSRFVLPLFEVPENYGLFHVTAQYSHYKRHALRVEIEERLMKFASRHRTSPTFWKITSWCLSRLPEPKAEIVEISTPVVTNRFLVEPLLFDTETGL